MADEQANAMSQVESAQEVDRIRDIIFGPQMRDYEQRFQIIQRDLDRLQNLRREMRQADEDLRDELRQTAQNLMTDKVDRVALGELFIELGTHLKTGGSLADVLESLGDKIE
jgi:hypothetical protein